MKILAIDYGKKRTGIAETDDLQLIASPLTTVDTSRLWDFLKKYLEENRVETLVVGEPLREDGTYNEIEKDIRAFLKRFAKAYPHIRIEREDERFTSKMAVRAMVEGGVPKKKRRNKALTDKVSAALILQDYLNRRG
ncbi:MAG: Holliday junction resolvase RuvX [Chlorobi bacterium]|nr:Holliday junction resolvase RuvX [Chlorobiota bacterium]